MSTDGAIMLGLNQYLRVLSVADTAGFRPAFAAHLPLATSSERQGWDPLPSRWTTHTFPVLTLSADEAERLSRAISRLHVTLEPAEAYLRHTVFIQDASYRRMYWEWVMSEEAKGTISRVVEGLAGRSAFVFQEDGYVHLKRVEGEAEQASLEEGKSISYEEVLDTLVAGIAQDDLMSRFAGRCLAEGAPPEAGKVISKYLVDVKEGDLYSQTSNMVEQIAVRVFDSDPLVLWALSQYRSGQGDPLAAFYFALRAQDASPLLRSPSQETDRSLWQSIDEAVSSLSTLIPPQIAEVFVPGR